jgi:hypothetical protein
VADVVGSAVFVEFAHVPKQTCRSPPRIERRSDDSNSYAGKPKQCMMGETVIAMRGTRRIAVMDVVKLATHKTTVSSPDSASSRQGAAGYDFSKFRSQYPTL